MDLLSVKLAGLASLHKLNDVVERRGPVESTTEYLPDESPCRRVVSTVPAVYVNLQLLPLVPVNATQ